MIDQLNGVGRSWVVIDFVSIELTITRYGLKRSWSVDHTYVESTHFIIRGIKVVISIQFVTASSELDKDIKFNDPTELTCKVKENDILTCNNYNMLMKQRKLFPYSV